jgi:hypothetical protein
MGGMDRRQGKAHMSKVRFHKNKKNKEVMETGENIDLVVSDPKHVIYWQVHIDTLQALHSVGIHYNLNDRIPTFRIYNELEKLKKQVDETNQHLIIDAQCHIDRLVKYRNNGYEPPFEKDKYK